MDIPLKDYAGKDVVFKVKEFMSNWLSDELKRIAVSSDNNAEKEIKSKNLVLTKMVIEPKITPEYLKSEECEGTLMDLLWMSISTKIMVDDKRFDELKKKLDPQSA